MQRSGGNNGNIYDLRKDLQRPQAPSQKKETSGSTDSRYGFNGEPLSFAPDRTSNGAVRRTRTDNSIEFPTQPRRTAQSSAPRTRSQGQNRSAPRSRTASAGRNSSGAAHKPQQRRPQSRQTGQTADRAARQRYKNQRLRPAHSLGHKVEFLAVFAAAQLNADAVRVAAVRVEIDAARAAVPCDIRVANRLPDLVFVHKVVR